MKSYSNIRQIMVKIILLFFIIISVFSPGEVKAAGVYNSISLPIKQQAPKKKWCWACCGAACVKYTRGISISKEDFAEQVKGNTTNDLTATMNEVRNGLSDFLVHGAIGSGAMSFNSIMLNIDDLERPVIVGWKYYDSSLNCVGGHMVTIMGYGVITGTNTVNKVNYMDPAYNTYQWATYSSFCSKHISLSNVDRIWAEFINQIY